MEKGGAHRFMKSFAVMAVIALASGLFAVLGAVKSEAELATQDQDPIGTIQLYMGSSDPGGGWVIADGRTLSRSTYSELFTVTGTTYGAGDGSTTFAIPDLRGRNLVGVDTVAGSGGRITSGSDTLGGTGGEDRHTLTAAESGVPAHSHPNTLSDPSHSHQLTGYNGGGPWNWWGAIEVYHTGPNSTLTNGSGSGSSISNANNTAANASASHNVLDNYQALNYIIKIASSGSGDQDPIGSVQAYSGASDPSGGDWVLADGRALSRTTYSSLFTTAGVAFGAGDGSTTFNIADLRGRGGLGVDSTAGAGGRVTVASDTRGSTGGEDRHTLTASETGVPAHSHPNTLSDPGHSHQLTGYNAGAWDRLWGALEAYAPGGDGVNMTSYASSSLSINNANNTAANASASHNVLDPYQVTQWVVKVSNSQGSSADTDPLGSIQGYAGSADPAGDLWLLANGRARSRSTSPTLFSLTGSTFGAGDGSTTFNLPDLRGRHPLGVDTSAGAAGRITSGSDTLGGTGGSDRETLTAAQSGVPAHSHPNSISNGSHAHGVNGYQGGGGNYYGAIEVYSGGPNATWSQGAYTGVSLSNANNSAANASSSHNVLDNYLVANWIVKDSNDRTPPVATWSPPSSPTNVSTLSFGLSFNESVTGLTSGDLTNQGTATGCSFSVSGSGSSYTISVSSCSAGTVIPQLTANGVTDTSGNNGPAAATSSSSVTVDRTAPTLSWSQVPSSPTNAASLTYQLSSTETLTGLTSGDLTNQGTATGCSFSVSGSSSPYTISAASCSEGTVVLRLTSSSVSDAAGNSAPAAALDASSVTVDRTPPSITWGTTPVSPNNSASFTYQITFGKNVTDITSADFSNSGTATGCVFTPSASTGSSVSVTVSSCSAGTLNLVLGASAVADAAGNTAPSSAMTASSVTIDRTAPTLSWSQVPSSPTNAASLTYQLSSTETLTGLTSGDLTNQGTATGCSFSVSGSSSPYTISAASCSEGTVVLRLTSSSVSDAAGNSAPAAALDASSVTVDRTAATASWTAPSSPSNSQSLSFALALSESVTGLTASDLDNAGTATGCSFSVSGSGSSYTVTAASCSEGTVAPRLAISSVSDGAGNPSPSAPAASSAVTVDRTAATASWTAPSSPSNSASLSFALVLSENVSGVAAGGFTNIGTATGCSFSVSGSGSSYTVTASSCSEGTVRLRMASGAAVDGAGNASPASFSDSSSVSIDRTTPSASWAAPPGPTKQSSLAFNLEFSEVVYGLSSADLQNIGTATGCSFSPSESSGQSFVVTVTGCSEGTVRLRLITSAVADPAGNNSSLTDSGAVTIDRTAPTADWTQYPSSPASSASLQYRLVFNEPASGFSPAQLTNTGTATGCEFSIIAGEDGKTFDVTATGCSEGTLGLRLPPGLAADNAGNTGPSTDTIAPTIIIDRTAPALSWSSVPSTPNNASSLTYQLSSSKDLSGLTSGDISNIGTATGCSFSVSGSSSPYTISASSCSEGTVILRLASGSVSDTAGNTAPASNLDASSVTIDRTAPTASFTASPSSPNNSSSLSYTLGFSESISGLAGADFSNQGTATGCSFSPVSSSGSSIAVSVSDCSEGTVILRLASGAVSDTAGNTAPVSNLDASAVTVDRTDPVASWTEPASPSAESTLSYSLSFPEPVSDLVSTDLSNEGTATGCSFSVSGSGSTYTIEATDCSEGTVVIRLASGAVSDSAGNPSSQSDTSSVTIDRTSPTASFTQEPTSPTNASTLSYDLSFSESVAGLTGADFSNQGTATGCSFSPVSSSGSSIAVSVSDCSEGTVILRLASGSVSDAAGNAGPTAAVSASSLTIDRTAPTASFTQEPVSPTNSSTLSYSLSFSEPVSGLTSGDFSNTGTALGCSFSVSGSGDSYTVVASSCSDGTVVLRLASGSVTDAADNDGPAYDLDASSVTVDRAPAAVSWGEPASPTKATSLSYVLNFSKPVTGLSAGDLSNTGTATGCSFSVSGSGDSYTVTTSSCSEGTVVLRLAGGSVTSEAGTASPASADSASSVTVDRTAPTASFTQVPSSPTGSESLDYQLTFSEAVTGLTSGDFSNAGNATDCVFSTSASSGTVFTVNASGCSSGSLILRLASGAVQDEALNYGPAAALSASSVTIALIPVNSEAPAITGDAETGKILTASSGTWNRSPSYAYQWQSSSDGSSGWSNISGEISSAYTVGSAQAGKHLRVKVTATNAVGSTVAYSSSVGPIIDAPQNPVSPSISGNSYPNNNLTLSAGSWTGYPDPSLSYQWQYCDAEGLNCQDIQGETSLTYTVQESDRGYRIRAQVTGANTAGSLVAYSAPTSEVTDQAPSPPALQSEISITSTPEAGQTASTDGGTWSGYPEPTREYQWQVCEIGGACTDVPSQQAALDSLQVSGRDRDFTPTTERAGKQLRVRVTATNSEGAVSEYSARSGGVRAKPWRISSPSFGGAAAVGQVLVALPGSWGGYPAPSFTYTWQLCAKDGSGCSPISVSGSGYKGLAEHAGKRLKFSVSATNSLGSESATSDLSSAVQGVPVNTGLPQLTGIASSGQTLTVSNGSWDSVGDLSYTYQWQRCDFNGSRCSVVAGASSSAYSVSGSDAGYRLRARVIAANERGQTSALSALTSQATSPTGMIAAPGISGTAVVGRALAALAGRWSGFPAPSFTYQWQRCQSDGSNCTDLAGSTASSYGLSSADYGKRIRLQVTAANSFNSVVALSAPSAIVGSPPTVTDHPEIVGDAMVGETLAVDKGEWESATTPSYAYQWQQCDGSGAGCRDIKRAVGDKLQVSTGQIGGTLKVRVVSSNTVGSAAALTDPTDQVEGAPVNTRLPAISGSDMARSTLTVSPGAWASLPSASYSYQWQRCRGSDCTDIDGATGTSFVTPREFVGFRVRVKVVATNQHGSSTMLSQPVGPVKVASYPLNMEAPLGGFIKVVTTNTVCQGKCKMLIPDGTRLLLTGGAQPAFVFERFTGSTCSGRGPCEFTMDGPVSVGAEISPSPELSLSYSLSKENLLLWQETNLSIKASVTPVAGLIRPQPGVRVCVVVPDTLTVPSVPEGATLSGQNLCWALGEITPPESRDLSVTLKARSRTGHRSVVPVITGLNRETVRGRPSSGSGYVRVAVRY